MYTFSCINCIISEYVEEKCLQLYFCINRGCFVDVFICCHLQANKSDLSRKEREMWNISVQGLIHVGVIIVVDFLFHYMYILTIPTDMKLLKHLSDWALGLYHLSENPTFILWCVNQTF